MTLERKTARERHEILERQQKELEGDETYVMTRSADHSFWVRSGIFLERYKVIWYLILGVGLALGFDFKTPRQFYAELQRQVDSQAKQLIEADRDRKVLNDKLDILIRFRCLDQTGREMSIAGVDCTKYVNFNLMRQP